VNMWGEGNHEAELLPANSWLWLGRMGYMGNPVIGKIANDDFSVRLPRIIHNPGCRVGWQCRNRSPECSFFPFL